MAYISSNNNRWYCQVENAYGQVPQPSGQARLPAVNLSVQQRVEVPTRKDKTGTRTYTGTLANLRKHTAFDLSTYMASWTGAGSAPGYGPLFQGALGASPLYFNGGIATNGSSSTTVVFGSSHGLATGQAITIGGEIRFVVSVIDSRSVLVNSPFSTAPATGSAIGATVTYFPSTELPSVSIFDYWTPATVVQRLLSGCAIDRLDVELNGDYQVFRFKGYAQDVLDSASFVAGQGQLNAFPSEPATSVSPATIVPGHLGQAWLGSNATRFFTLTGARVSLRNQIDMRTREFGSILPRAINPGARIATLDLSLYGQDDPATISLYQAARQRTPISVGLQLGQATGQLCGAWLKSVVPEVPDYNGKENRLQWEFRGLQAQGLGNDEAIIAFG